MAVIAGLWQKIFIRTIQVNFCPHPRNQHKIHLLLKIFAKTATGT